MKRSFGSLIIMPPSSPRVHQLRLTRRAVLFCLGAGLFTFCLVVTASVALPSITDGDRVRLEKENDVLRTENKHLEVQAKKLDFRLSQLEEASKRISNLMEAD